MITQDYLLSEQQHQEDPFDIIKNARSSRASKTRKSSTCLLQRDRPIPKFKKLRKMTLNPQSIRYHELNEFQSRHANNYKSPGSERGQIKQQQFCIDEFLQLGGPRKLQSEKEIQLQKGIFVGIISEKELDSDFNLSSHQLDNLMQEQMGQ